MEQISIFNYEIFYLDYLEGKLGEKDVALLMQFFKEHPECELEDTDLPTLSVDDTPVYKGKSSLKQIENSEAITAENVEHFMISNAEGLLSNQKSKELNQFIESDVNLEKDNARYKAVYFEADQTVVFENKEELKRKKTIVLWPYISAAAAAAVISFVFLMNGNGSDSIQGNTDPIAIIPEKKIPVVVDENAPLTQFPVVFEENSMAVQSAVNYTPQGPRLEKETPKEKFESMAFRKPHNMQSSFDKKLKVIPRYESPLPKDLDNNDADPLIAQVVTEQKRPMYDPIEPVTSFIAKKTNKDIEFTTRKATKKEKGGFFIKIGNFEISKNKH